jgi:hypothetical protein
MLCQQGSARVAQLLTDDRFAQLGCRRGFDLDATDGPWHRAAVHADPIDGAKRAIGHFFALNLRTQALTHLTPAQGKKEHERPARKPLARDTRRQHAPAGRKVLTACDCASIDYARWQKRKQSGGGDRISLPRKKRI